MKSLEAPLDRHARDLAAGSQLLLVLGLIRRDGPIHGYALIKAMEATTGGAFWKEGTIYPLLARLERDGVLRALWGQGDGGPPRKKYALTDDGARLLRHARLAWTDHRERLDALLEEP